MSSVASSSYGGMEDVLVSANAHGLTIDPSQGLMNLDRVLDQHRTDRATPARSTDRGSHDPNRTMSGDNDENGPHWSELKTKAGKERKRLPLACIACRRKKIRCSGTKPACKHCTRSRIPCVYKVSTRKATPRTDYMAMLDKRLKRMEDRVIKLLPKDSGATSVPRAVVRPAASKPAKSPKRTKKRGADEAFGFEDMDSWARNDQTRPSTAPSRKEENTLFAEGKEFLPPKEIQFHLAEVYFEHVYGQSYPLLHKPTFLRNLLAGNVPPLLVLSVCAISARFSNHPKVRSHPPFLRGEQWAAPARDIALKRFDSPNITVLTSYLLLGLHEFGTCQGGRSWMFAGMAQRMSFMLQLHKDRDMSDQPSKENPDGRVTPRLNHTDREIRRRVMWSCFLMDRFISSGSDRPICIPEDCISVPLPIKESMFLMEIYDPASDKKDTGDVSKSQDDTVVLGTSAYLVRLVFIWGRLVKYFNLGGRQRDKVPMWHDDSPFKELSGAIRNFKFPEALAWTADNLATFRAEKEDNQFVFLHIVYQHMRLFAHRFALPGSGMILPRNIPQSFLAEASRIAFDAANQVSMLVKEALNCNCSAPFAGYAAFYSSTVHVQALFSKSTQTVARAKENLATNVKFLGQMKKWWGMFHFVEQDLKELYRTHTDAHMARKANGEETEDGDRKKSIFQYGDWFDKYPNGVSNADPEDPAKKASDDGDKLNQGVLGAKEDKLVSVEEFFSQLTSDDMVRARRTHNKSSDGRRRRKESVSDFKLLNNVDGQMPMGPGAENMQHTGMPHGGPMPDNAYGTAPTYMSGAMPSNMYPLSIDTSLGGQSGGMMLGTNSGLTDFATWPLDVFGNSSGSPVAGHADMHGAAFGMSASYWGGNRGMNTSWYPLWNVEPPVNDMVDSAGISVGNTGMTHSPTAAMSHHNGHGSNGSGNMPPGTGGMNEWEPWTTTLGADIGPPSNDGSGGMN